MSAQQAFVDESTRRGYLVCAVVLPHSDLADTRRDLKALLMPGQRKIHMTKEGGRRRRQILSAIQALKVEALLFEAQVGSRSQRAARDDCFRALVPALTRRGVSRVVVESCDQDHQDVRVISDAVAKEQAHDRLHYLHSAPASEPLLWLPDIVAWAHGAGGDWSRRTRGLITEIHNVTP